MKLVMAGVIWCLMLSASAETWHDSVTIPEVGHDVLTDDLTDVECMALAIYWEARGERRLGRELIAQLITDRVADRHYPFDNDLPNTACGIVRDPGQFDEWARDGKSDKPTNTGAWRDAYLMAIEFQLMGRVAPVPDAGQILAVHAVGTNPGWHDMVAIIRYDNQIFYARKATYQARRQKAPSLPGGSSPGHSPPQHEPD